MGPGTVKSIHVHRPDQLYAGLDRINTIYDLIACSIKTEAGRQHPKIHNIECIVGDIYIMIELLCQVGITSCNIQRIRHIRYILQLSDRRLIGTSTIPETKIFTSYWCKVEAGCREKIGIARLAERVLGRKSLVAIAA